MRQLKIVRLDDSYDCDQAGCSGGWAQGARIEIDGVVVKELTPKAHCLGGDSFEDDAIMQAVIEALGITDVEVEYDFEGD